MSTGEQQAPAAKGNVVQDAPLLEQILAAMPSTVERDTGADMVRTLVQELLHGQVTWDQTLSRTIDNRIAQIDKLLSEQVAAILHHEKFQALEGTWRGVNYLVSNSLCDSTLKINLLSVTKRELTKQFEHAKAFDQSVFFKKIYNRYDTFGASPYGMLVGDYEFSNHPDDVKLLRNMSNVCAAAFCPFISAASSKLFQLESFTQLPEPNKLERVFEQPAYASWRGFRESEDSRFVVLTMPRVLSRLPYGANTNPIDEFHFEEVLLGARGEAIEVPHEHFAWMNSAYAMAARMTTAFTETGWCTRIRGIEGGGVVENLPVFAFKSSDGDEKLKCPSEIAITERREHELSNLGFLPLCHWDNTDYSAFIGGQTAQKPKEYYEADATANAAISARLPYVMAASRIAHHLKAMARDWIGSFKEQGELETKLNSWISNYVIFDAAANEAQKAQRPLKDAKITVEKIEGRPGAYHAVAYLRPWLQFEELKASIRMVAEIPKIQ